MKGGPRSSRFLFNLEKKIFTNFAEMLAQAKKYANAKEDMVTRKEAAPSRPEGREKLRDMPTDEG